jgi:hypothetical protein
MNVLDGAADLDEPRQNFVLSKVALHTPSLLNLAPQITIDCELRHDAQMIAVRHEVCEVPNDVGMLERAQQLRFPLCCQDGLGSVVAQGDFLDDHAMRRIIAHLREVCCAVRPFPHHSVTIKQCQHTAALPCIIKKIWPGPAHNVPQPDKLILDDDAHENR